MNAENTKKVSKKGTKVNMIILTFLMSLSILSVVLLSSNAIASLLILIVETLYFLPYLISACRNHKNSAPIFILNIFLGWTLIGWVIGMIWACLSMESK